MSRPRVSFKTVGCRLNRAETAIMAAGFEAQGYEIVPHGEPCDVCVIHGCAVTGRAQHTSVRCARAAERSAAPPIVVVAGCVAEAAGLGAGRAPSNAHILVGQDGKFDIPGLLRERFPALATARRPPEPAAARLLPRFDSVRAWIKAQDGCDFRCAYCIVPLTRGRDRSRPFSHIAEEVLRLADAGFKEIVLSGANLGCYRDGTRGLVDLLRLIEAMPAVQRIRVSSIEPTTAERDIIEFMARSSKLCRYLHIPMQSGDDRILAAMGRRYTRDTFRRAAEHAVATMPMIGLGTDVLVGFPGEDDAAFEATVDLVEALPFSKLHVFAYSRRPGTRAAAMPDPVPAAVKKERVNALLAVEARKRRAFAGLFVGRPVSVLLQGVTPGGGGHGWTGEYLDVRIRRGCSRPNEILTVVPSRSDGQRLCAEAPA